MSCTESRRAPVNRLCLSAKMEGPDCFITCGDHLMTLRDNPRIDSPSSLDRQALRSPLSPSDTAIANYAGRELQPNRGVPLNLDWVNAARVNTTAVERRAQTIGTRRSVKKEWQAAWLLRAVTCMDLTTLSGDDTDERVRRLCAKARQPIQRELIQKLGVESLDIKVAAVCVYHTFVETARRAIEGSGIHVAAVSTGFPAGLSPFEERVAEIRRSVEAGADEIDVVITRAHVFGAKWQALYDEIATFKNACGPASVLEGSALRRNRHLQERLRARAFEGDPGRGRFVDAAQRGARQHGGDDGRGGFHQDIYWQGSNERDTSREPGDGARHPRVRAGNRNGRGFQASGWHSHGETIARLARADEGGTRRFVAQGRVIPVWGQRHAGGYRTAVGA